MLDHIILIVHMIITSMLLLLTVCDYRDLVYKAKTTFSSLHFHAILTLIPIFYFYRFYSLFRKMPSILVLCVSALTTKSYVADGTIKIKIKNFILALKNATSVSKLKIIIY